MCWQVCLGCSFMYCFLFSNHQVKGFYFFNFTLLFASQGTKSVEGLALKLERTSSVCFSTNAFAKMTRLRLLQLDHVQLAGDYEYLPKQLRWLYWRRFPFKYLPNNFYQGSLVAIDLKRSNLRQVWKRPQVYITWHFPFKRNVMTKDIVAIISFSILLSNFSLQHSSLCSCWRHWNSSISAIPCTWQTHLTFQKCQILKDSFSRIVEVCPRYMNPLEILVIFFW